MRGGEKSVCTLRLRQPSNIRPHHVQNCTLVYSLNVGTNSPGVGVQITITRAMGNLSVGVFVLGEGSGLSRL